MSETYIEITDADGDKQLIQIRSIIRVERCGENNSTLVLDNEEHIYAKESVQEIQELLR